MEVKSDDSGLMAQGMSHMSVRKPVDGTPGVPAETGNAMNMTLGMAYVPVQRWETPYPAETAFETGTIFPSLDMPFFGSMGGGMIK